MADYRFSKIITNDLQELPLLTEQIELLGDQANWPPAVVMQINLVIEELIVNTINYGYSNGRVGTIEVNIETNSQTINIEIKDDGDAFNPLENNAPDITLEIENRPIGGLGIFIVKNYMDTFDYYYANNQNCTSLSKQL